MNKLLALESCFRTQTKWIGFPTFTLTSHQAVPHLKSQVIFLNCHCDHVTSYLKPVNFPPLLGERPSSTLVSSFLMSIPLTALLLEFCYIRDLTITQNCYILEIEISNISQSGHNLPSSYKHYYSASTSPQVPQSFLLTYQTDHGFAHSLFYLNPQQHRFYCSLIGTVNSASLLPW